MQDINSLLEQSSKKSRLASVCFNRLSHLLGHLFPFEFDDFLLGDTRNQKLVNRLVLFLPQLIVPPNLFCQWIVLSDFLCR